ncbi:MAG TPA: efflux RND transporter periplasmic adaptor subunit [Thermoanaerobaculia bacterium]|nr:efflux RND transporter periplasmic adaptor subunit [Thermoanaerobaculia bacterium]
MIANNVLVDDIETTAERSARAAQQPAVEPRRPAEHEAPTDLAEDRPHRVWWRRPEAWVAALAVLVAVAALVWGGGDRGGEDFQDPMEATPVRTATVGLGELEIVSSYPGELVGEVSDIASQVSGLLEDVPVRIGNRVSRGQVIAVIDDLDLRNQLDEAKGQVGVAAANTRRAEAELESIRAEYRRAEELFRQSLISEQEYERVRANLASARANVAVSEAQAEQAAARLAQLERQLADTRVVAPFDGIVAARYLDRGALVQPTTPILRLVESSPLVVQFRVPERDLGSVLPGVAFATTTQATGDRVFVGVVRRVSGEVSRTDRTAIVEGELQRGEELLRPGMYAEVEVRLRAIEGELIVPGNAVVERVAMDGTKARGVFLAAEAGEGAGQVAQWVSVELLGESQGRAAVAGDLRLGDTVLTLGHTELRDGAPIRVVQHEGERPAAGAETSR